MLQQTEISFYGNRDDACVCMFVQSPDKSFPNRIKSNWNQIVFTVHRLIWNQKNVRFVSNQSKNGQYNLISVWFNKITKWFLCVHTPDWKNNIVRLPSLGITGAQLGALLNPLAHHDTIVLRGSRGEMPGDSQTADPSFFLPAVWRNPGRNFPRKTIFFTDFFLVEIFFSPPRNLDTRVGKLNRKCVNSQSLQWLVYTSNFFGTKLPAASETPSVELLPNDQRRV